MASEIGLVGLGTMGAALALNIAEKGFAISVYNRTGSVTDAFKAGAGPLAERITATATLEALVASIQAPRAIILMVPAGEAVDAMMASLRALLEPGDLIIDAGNANFRDTRRRAAEAGEAGVPFLGIGVSGGEEGARHGPSIMGGGDREAWERVRPVLEAVAAKFEGEPCATYMGADGAGHFVKTVHNGIEYADMQMIAEVYGILRDGLGMGAPEIGDVFARWNGGPLRSYLIEISAEVAKTVDPETGAPLLDVILDSAGQKGTGRWTAIEALHLAAPASTIEAAVGARTVSSMIDARRRGEAVFGAAPRRIEDEGGLVGRLEQALLVGKIACYAQGFGLLEAASAEYGWDLPMDGAARVWRAGCIIRSTMLDDMASALAENPGTNLMFAEPFARRMRDGHGALREVVATAALSGAPVPALSAGLAYFDMMRTGRSTANMLQGQRDFFGRHSFGRLDRPGVFHGPWADA